MKPLCFVLMPFGKKADPTGGSDIDFDQIYAKAIKPAIEDAEMEPVRADEESTGGIIHKAMFERLLLCDYAVADLTTANANVFYELGVRHTARPATTVTIYAEKQPIPFDIGFLRSIPYELGESNAVSTAMVAKLRLKLSSVLQERRELAIKDGVIDSPLFQLVGGWETPAVAHIKTDVFRKQVAYNKELKEQLTDIREMAKFSDTKKVASKNLEKLRTNLGSLDTVEGGTIIDLLLTYRALSDWQGMVQLQEDMPKVLGQQVLVQEQLGFALNRRASNNPALRTKALNVLQGVVSRQGANSETCGLIGRIYKDKWVEAVAKGQTIEAEANLDKAIEAYIRGFMADQRDAYPGINAVTLLDIRGDAASLRHRMELLPIVRFSTNRRLESKEPDYWDHATLLELAILENNENEANECFKKALISVREYWELETTENNLQLIITAREQRGENQAWVTKIMQAISQKQRQMGTD